MCKVQCHIACQHDTSGKQVEGDGRSEAVAGWRYDITLHSATSCDIMRWARRAEQWETWWYSQKMWQSGGRLAEWLEHAAVQQKT